MQSIGSVVGFVSGAALSEFVSWRLNFWVVLPFFLLSWIFAFFVPFPQFKKQPIHLDYGGVLSLVTVVSLSILLIILGPMWGWVSAPVICFYAIIPTAMLMFCSIERQSKNPLVNFYPVGERWWPLGVRVTAFCYWDWVRVRLSWH